MNILIAAILLCNLLVFCLLLHVSVEARRKYREVESAVRSFLSAPDDKTPSPLAQTIDAAGQVMARAIIVQAKTTLMGMNSGAVRAEQAVEKQAAMAKFPWLGALNTFAPGITKSLMKNPALLNLAQGALQKAGNGTVQAPPPPRPGSNGHRTEPVRFEL